MLFKGFSNIKKVSQHTKVDTVEALERCVCYYFIVFFFFFFFVELDKNKEVNLQTEVHLIYWFPSLITRHY